MKKNILINIFLIISVISGTFLIIESFIEHNLVTKIPVKFQFALPAGLAVLNQSSKDNTLPHNYIALAGDSYAQGKGDWILQIDPDSNDAFHSAHVLNRLTGRDVISFGKSGASNIKGWVREPIARYQFIHNNIDENFETPKLIIAYFYAGNDLLENMLEIKEDFIPEFGVQNLNDDKAWEQFFLETIKSRKVGPFSGINSNTGWFPRAVVKVIKNEIKTGDIRKKLGDIQVRHDGNINRVVVDNKEVKIPDVLQSPALELSPEETELGFIATVKSLKYLKQSFPDSQLVVVYIPSVIESYAKTSDKVSISNIIAETPAQSAEIHSASELGQRSNEIANRVKTISESMDIPFIDTRPDIKEASTKQIIHGPLDWKHFNKPGYTTLAESVYTGLKKHHLLINDKNTKSDLKPQ